MRIRNARLADKRRSYACYIAATEKYVAIEHNMAVEHSKGCSEERMIILRSDWVIAMTTMLNALGEIRLIASESLAALAVDVTRLILRSDNLSRDFPEIRDRLSAEMLAEIVET